MLQLSAFWPHLGALQAASSLSVVWEWTAPSWVPWDCPNVLQLRPARREIAAPVTLQRLRNYSAVGTCGRQHRGQQGGRFFSKYTTPDRSFVAALRSSDRQQPWQKKLHRDTNQIAGQPVQAKNVTINATDYVFLAFTMVKQITTACSFQLFVILRKGCGMTQTSRSC
jgi:hypothetical protein